jgi:hypothetical protein
MGQIAQGFGNVKVVAMKFLYLRMVMKLQIAMAIPYRSFKERMRLMKKYEKLGTKITVYDNYLLVEGTCLL